MPSGQPSSRRILALFGKIDAQNRKWRGVATPIQAKNSIVPDWFSEWSGQR
jgi:hypothetical protein